MQMTATNLTAARVPLRRVLLADGITCAVSGVLFPLAAVPLSGSLGLSESFLRIVGLSLLPVAAFVLSTATRPQINRVAVTTIGTLNLLWVIGSALLLVSGWVDLTTPGIAFVVAQALMVLAFAELQLLSLRHSL